MVTDWEAVEAAGRHARLGKPRYVNATARCSRQICTEHANMGRVDVASRDTRHNLSVGDGRGNQPMPPSETPGYCGRFSQLVVTSMYCKALSLRTAGARIDSIDTLSSHVRSVQRQALRGSQIT